MQRDFLNIIPHRDFSNRGNHKQLFLLWEIQFPYQMDPPSRTRNTFFFSNDSVTQASISKYHLWKSCKAFMYPSQKILSSTTNPRSSAFNQACLIGYVLWLSWICPGKRKPRSIKESIMATSNLWESLDPTRRSWPSLTLLLLPTSQAS